ncbi:MAG TPA: type II toxin-antitoxin system HigB family toxin [Pyrinomonadaceae bacterium]|jgi:mRNA interferase HigB
MNTISFKAIREFVSSYPDSKASLTAWYKIAKKARWRNLAEVRQIYPHADPVGIYTIFNIRGNHYRLVVEINYQYQQILIRKILTHEEYDQGKWKQ